MPHTSEIDFGWHFAPGPITQILFINFALKFRKILYIFSTRITKKCAPIVCKYFKNRLRWGFATDPTGGAYSAPPGPLDGFSRVLSEDSSPCVGGQIKNLVTLLSISSVHIQFCPSLKILATPLCLVKSLSLFTVTLTTDNVELAFLYILDESRFD